MNPIVVFLACFNGYLAIKEGFSEGFCRYRIDLLTVTPLYLRLQKPLSLISKVSLHIGQIASLSVLVSSLFYGAFSGCALASFAG